MLGDSTTAVRWAYSAMRAFSSSLKPVVPMTSLTPSSAQMARWSIVAASARSSLCAMASISMRPMRPEAPATATRRRWLLLEEVAVVAFMSGKGCTSSMHGQQAKAAPDRRCGGLHPRKNARMPCGARAAISTGAGFQWRVAGRCGRRLGGHGLLHRLGGRELGQLLLAGFQRRNLAQLLLGAQAGDEFGLGGHLVPLW